jgi:DNA-binding transcriptional LysR family regulator
VRENLSGLRLPIGGELSLAASSVPGECFLPALLSQFREKYPQVHVRATVHDSRLVFHEVEKGEAVLGIVANSPIRPTSTFGCSAATAWL